MTGGCSLARGPTADDLTLAAVAQGAGLPLRLDPVALVKDQYDWFFEQGVMAEGVAQSAREKWPGVLKAERLYSIRAARLRVLDQAAGPPSSVCPVCPRTQRHYHPFLAGFLDETLDWAGRTAAITVALQ